MPIVVGGGRLSGADSESEQVPRSEYTIPNEAIAKIDLERSEAGEFGSYSQFSSVADLKSVKFANVKNIK